MLRRFQTDFEQVTCLGIGVHSIIVGSVVHKR